VVLGVAARAEDPAAPPMGDLVRFSLVRWATAGAMGTVLKKTTALRMTTGEVSRHTLDVFEPARPRAEPASRLFVCLFIRTEMHFDSILNHVFSAFLARLAFTFCPQRFSFAPCVEPASAEL
jgi:hypothetical protein